MDLQGTKEAFGDAIIASQAFIEEQYQRFQQNSKELDSSWSQLFTTFGQPVERLATINTDAQVNGLIDAYRKYGHLKAQVNPIERVEAKPWQLALDRFGFSEVDLNTPYPTFGILDADEAPLSAIIAKLEAIYCGTVGVEYMGIGRPEIEQWLQQRIESQGFDGNLTIEQKKMILQHLNKSELFEIFLHTKYTGQKRFSLEGAETLIPMLEKVVEKGAEEGVKEFFIGMAHRGRLNVLSNILNKPYSLIFSEFDENYIPESFEQTGDVKYHKGFFSETLSSHGHKVQIALTPNPSHLEAVNSVIEGQAYAKQLLVGREGKQKVLPILVHGDAALAGQGVVYETLQLQSLEGYGVGGTLHFVINNQIGFTTLPKESRSTRYCTDIALTFGAPTFHVNAEDPEGCVFVTCLAVELRQKFNCDVFIDLMCYRKYGHNEGDEPAFTQPHEYAKISAKKSIRELYKEDLIRQGVLEKKISEDLESEFKRALQEELKSLKEAPKEEKTVKTSTLSPTSVSFRHIQTGVSLSILQQIAEKACTVPEGVTVHPKLQRLLKDRLSMTVEGPSAKPLDWGMAEMLALGSLLWEGMGVRLSGQDCCRGTFSHRHAVWIDQNKEQPYCPLKTLKSNQGNFEVYNSSLSEYAVLGFEYGYSIANSNVLVIWEAQFGDFCNGAQVIIDQFISTGEQKWGQQSHLTLFLPHGYEGQGPEHSSARIERFLTLAGQNNLRIVNASTPAQFFHLLRRQQLDSEKKPLIVFTPKALLRHHQCVSRIDDLVLGSFQEILDEPKNLEQVHQLIVCSGHVYYDLVAERDRLQLDHVAIVRVEQLYPFNHERMQEIFAKYQDFKFLDWVQEEPANMGPAPYMGEVLRALLPSNVSFRSFSRPRSASPAVGSHAAHKKQLQTLVNQVFGSEEQPSIFEIASQTKQKSHL
ncbi:MAG: 2-oxoglutarate dehydrogenase E1 component [Parachlamydiaceae bacterium]